MKALDILKKQLKEEQYYIEIHTVEDTLSLMDIKEAILELEALQNRSCGNCLFSNSNLECENLTKYVYPDYDVLDNSGFYLIGYDVQKDFCCNKWELKQ